MTDDTTISFNGTGDRSVGIWEVEASLTVNISPDQFEDKERKELRKAFKEFCEEWFNDKSHGVWFNDECPDCHNKLGKDDECITKGCPSHEEEEENGN